VILVAGITQVAAAADRISLGFGQPVFLDAARDLRRPGAGPIAMYFRLPRPLTPPATSEGPEYEEYVRKLKAQLARNPLVAGTPLQSEGEVAAAIARLDQEADVVIRNTASAIFASTAVMQNGRLDALVVFGSQVRMTYPHRLDLLPPPVAPAAALHLRQRGRERAGRRQPAGRGLRRHRHAGGDGGDPVAQGRACRGCRDLDPAGEQLRQWGRQRVPDAARGAHRARLLRGTHLPRQGTHPPRATVAALAMVAEIAKEQGTRVAQAAWGAVSDAASSSVRATLEGTKNAVSAAGSATARLVGKDRSKE
jgi:hypothetical protein